VEADPNQLESALLNLAVNARDAMPRGGKLLLETANVHLDQQYAAVHAEVAPGNYVVIAMTDTGCGMSRETLARVFDPFFTTKEVGKGTGLGLSMVYGFVKQSGGHIKIYSEPGEGTTVKIYLPRLMSGEVVEEERSAPPVDRAKRGLTILVVEDDDDLRGYTVEILRELGYRVLEAHDGPAALRLLERPELVVDLLFTDVVMPAMSGRELADKTREMRPGLKVLYTSGYTRNAIVHGGRLDLGVEMIAKPFSYNGLAEKISDMLDGGQSGRVLVVEADPAVRMFAVEALREAGFTADEAADAAEALGRIRRRGDRCRAAGQAGGRAGGRHTGRAGGPQAADLWRGRSEPAARRAGCGGDRQAV
jgi:CheY-like chemotaxis protein